MSDPKIPSIRSVFVASLGEFVLQRRTGKVLSVENSVSSQIKGLCMYFGYLGIMTRINSGINPRELNNAMLIAEHREIKRIPNLVRQGKFSMESQPSQFTLGTGHVKFFYDKLGYLRRRYEAIYAECLRRRLNVTYFGNAWDGIDEKYMGEYTPTQDAADLVRNRIAERLKVIFKA